MKIITHDDDGNVIEQGSDAWKRLRVGLFTGTSMGDLMPGKRGGYTDARDKAIEEVVAEILTGEPVTGFKASKYMREGIEKEPYARITYQVLRDCYVEEVAFVRHEWLRCGCSPDGLVSGRRRGVEFKSPKETTHARYLMRPQALVDEYYSQVQTNMWMLEYDEWDLCSYHPGFKGGMELLIVTVKRDHEYIAKLDSEAIKAHAEVNTIIKKLREQYPAEEIAA